MIYNIRHVTSYSYQAPVAISRCTLRLTPRSDRDQIVRESLIDATPAPAQTTQRYDFFGNQATTLTVVTPHRTLTIASTARVEINRPGPPHIALTPRWENVRDTVVRSQSLAAISPAHFIYASGLVPMLPEITAYAKLDFTTGRPILEAAFAMMTRIRNDFAFNPKATDITNTVRNAFEQRAGVCQDFTHIMIAGLRGLGLPAAYVSGYIRTIPRPGAPRLEGADASHAWVSVWCGPEFGWHDLDPTNALYVENDHIMLARGRDYIDVAPIDGVIIGSGGQKLKVSVDVIPVHV